MGSEGVEKCRKKVLRVGRRYFSIALGIAVRGLCSEHTSKLKCVQFMLKTPLNVYKRPEPLFHAIIHLSIDLGMFQTAFLAQSLVRCFAVCTVRSVVNQAFKNLLFALWCWHLDNLLRPSVAESPKNWMDPSAWCPTADLEQGSRLTGKRTDIYMSW